MPTCCYQKCNSSDKDYKVKNVSFHGAGSGTWRRGAATAAAAVERRPITKLLVANRGEIACRVMRTARRLGIRTVAVYSDVDRDSLHVHTADEAYHIGPAPAPQSYLAAERLLEVARASGAQAVHPGYGFLSENLEFCTRCRDEGVIFVGPPAAAIRDMGIKSTSKAIMQAAGVPVVEGYHGEEQGAERLRAEAQRIGFPLMIKAVRGGGGKGMRIAATEAELAPQLESARREALGAFGDDAVLLEQYVPEPRHVEVQVFADRFGNAVHLFERDCSVQRRHQKIIEEAPAPGLSEETRQALGAAAVRAARAVGYEGAGTVEFILNKDTHAFHFMEMNTRLQVEHPITEMITGTDLVEWQLRVAAGEALPLTQAQIVRRGHAFECRVYAEEPAADFLPRAGHVLRLRHPAPHDHLRVETGVREGDEVSVHYDPMIAKLVVWGADRDLALARMRNTLAQYQVGGVETNVAFLMRLCDNPAFIAGDVHTAFIPQQRDQLFPTPQMPRERALRVAAALVLLKEEREREESAAAPVPAPVPAGWRPNYALPRTVQFFFNDQQVEVEMVRSREGWAARLAGEGDASWSSVRARLEGDVLHASVDAHTTAFPVARIQQHIYLYEQEGATCVETRPRRRGAARGSAAEVEADGAASPTPGVLERLLVKPGDTVEKGQPLCVVIAMKMEYVVRSPRAGVVAAVAASLLGAPVRKGHRLVSLQPRDS